MHLWISFPPRKAAVTALTGVCLLLFTIGCPQPQQPSAPVEDEDPGGPSSTIDPAPTPDPGRPIVPPVLEPEPGQSQPPATPGQPGGWTPGNAFLGFLEPFKPVVIRPPDEVDLVFTLALDAQTSVMSAELIVAKDANADGRPDDDPVALQSITLVEGRNTTKFSTLKVMDKDLLTNGFARLLPGVRLKTSSNKDVTGYAPAAILVDSLAPRGVFAGAGPQGALLDRDDHLVTKDAVWVVKFRTDDNAPHTATILLDCDTEPLSGNEHELFFQSMPAGARDCTVEIPLSAYASGTYYYYFINSDGAGGISFYALNERTGTPVRLGITSRLVGEFDLNRLDPRSPQYNNSAEQSQGAIMQGFNFNDLAGAAIASVPDLNADGAAEMIISSRFGKPYIVNSQGIGWGEAFLLYGNSARFRDVIELNRNVIGPGSLKGLAFAGIRTPLNESWTEGLSDMAVIPDMDGDELPELAFGFPRAESISLGAPITSAGIPYQHPDLKADLIGMGTLEYDAIRSDGQWENGQAQFVRGGLVIVSSHSTILLDTNERNRKGDRVIDLHEVGQLFNQMSRPALLAFTRAVSFGGAGCEDCEPNSYDPVTNECIEGCGDCGGITSNPAETPYEVFSVFIDTSFTSQGPGGFLQPWHYADEAGALFRGPPLASAAPFPYTLPPSILARCEGCEVYSNWYRWMPGCGGGLPGTNLICLGAWQAPGQPTLTAWTGFYGPDSTPRFTTPTGAEYAAPIGARLLGEDPEDRFGATVASDRTWLYIAAPNHTALYEDVPALNGPNRGGSGVVYMYRISSASAAGRPTRSQLWIEPEMTYPFPDLEDPERRDDTMPAPHQYVIETVGSSRGPASPITVAVEETSCTAASSADVFSATAWFGYYPYPVGTSGYYVDRTPQVVGPHKDARLAFVRTLGDLNDDGLPDFGVGSHEIRREFSNPNQPTGPLVGGVFIVFGRLSGFEGDYLLENLVRDLGAPERLHGVALFGTAPNDKLGSAFDAAGDFDGDGIDDVIVGGEGFDSGRGQALVILGSPTLESPAGGWTLAGIHGAGRTIHFTGAAPGDLAGANVAGAGDVDGDGLADVLIAAPGAGGGKGAVYLIYGTAGLAGQSLNLADTGTVNLPGVRFVGRSANDTLGGGMLSYTGTNPANPEQRFSAYSRGVAKLGDIDGDGCDDYAISAMLAPNNSRTNAGEVYVIYGRGE